MKVNETIAIIGAASLMGSGLARRLSREPVRLLLIDDASEELDVLKGQISGEETVADVEISGCSHTASWEADIIVLAVNPDDYPEIVPKISAVVIQKIVVGLGGTHERTGRFRQWFPHSRIVIVRRAEEPNGTGELCIDGDDQKSVARIAGWVLNMGMEPLF